MGLYVILWAAWIGFLFIPRFCKKQLWKTLIFACCYTVPLLAEGIDFAQKMQYQLDYGKLLSLRVFPPQPCAKVDEVAPFLSANVPGQANFSEFTFSKLNQYYLYFLL